MTFLEGEDRNFSDVRLYIQEYPQYASPSQLGSWIDLNDAFYNDAFYNDAFYNDAPYTGVWEDEIAVPLDLIDLYRRRRVSCLYRRHKKRYYTSLL